MYGVTPTGRDQPIQRLHARIRAAFCVSPMGPASRGRAKLTTRENAAFGEIASATTATVRGVNVGGSRVGGVAQRRVEGVDDIEASACQVKPRRKGENERAWPCAQPVWFMPPIQGRMMRGR